MVFSHSVAGDALIVLGKMLALAVRFEVDNLESIVRNGVKVLDVCEIEVLPKIFSILPSFPLLLFSLCLVLNLFDLLFSESDLLKKLSSSEPHLLGGAAFAEELNHEPKVLALAW